MNGDLIVRPLADGPDLGYLTRPATPSPDIKFWWLGQAGFAVEHAGRRILLDPYLSDSLATKYAGTIFPHTRLHSVPVDPSEIQGVSAVLHSHAHTDHLDPATVQALLTRNSPRFIAPRARSRIALERNVPARSFTPVTTGDRIEIATDITVTAVPAAHETLETDEYGDSVFLGFIIDIAGVRIYHSGDCVPYEGQAKLLRAHGVDVALLPINGRDSHRLTNGVPGNFTVAEAISLCSEARIPAMVGHHFGLFDFNTINPDDAVAEFTRIAGDLQWTVPTVGRPYGVTPPRTPMSCRQKAAVMNAEDLEESLRQLAIVPVIEIEDADDAIPLGRTLVEAGLPVAEVTFRTDAAAEAIARMVKNVPGLLVGAGTVLSEDDVDAAADAGAHFIVSPGLNAAVVRRARERSVPIIPGVTSPTEIEAARSLGLRLLKLFPAEAIGGIRLVRALGAPYPDVSFMPTGGITPETVAVWLSEPSVIACGGSWIATRDAVAGRRWDEIRGNAAGAAELAADATRSRAKSS